MVNRVESQELRRFVVRVDAEKGHGTGFFVALDSLSVGLVDSVTVPAFVHTPDLDTTLAIVGFILGLVPLLVIPTREQVEDYLLDNFSTAGEGFRLSCAQGFMHTSSNLAKPSPRISAILDPYRSGLTRYCWPRREDQSAGTGPA